MLRCLYSFIKFMVNGRSDGIPYSRRTTCHGTRRLRIEQDSVALCQRRQQTENFTPLGLLGLDELINEPMSDNAGGPSPVGGMMMSDNVGRLRHIEISQPLAEPAFVDSVDKLGLAEIN
ncbi:uncharacterized protein PADG_05795 [Paracoccidioides brasiliensis Pb18]|uniref:Uncharacterized protein n=1 Tax=Paracoccidioides brasiliensis (strain Pb18) TaxID=502780 RepID=C1GEV9_PARBD|nr:uncharacterized protein PADG_05795 [Paracoccidioides brasiliensis Pb18]EEH49716.2 hypothetical protein PADG_05795 [Paracoccidioides brasiliensis Pb18]